MFRKVLFIWSSVPIFSFIKYALTELFTNLTIDDKLINKQVRRFTQQTMCREEKNFSTSSQGCEIALNITFFKKKKQCISSHRRCGSSHQRCSVRKGVLKNFANSTGKYLCWSLFLWSCKPSTCKFFKKRLQHKLFAVKFAKFCEYLYLQTTASGGVL